MFNKSINGFKGRTTYLSHASQTAMKCLDFESLFCNTITHIGKMNKWCTDNQNLFFQH